MMAAIVATSALSCLPAMPAGAQGMPSANPIGTWLTEGGHGVIRIAPCEQGLCGAIVGMDLKPGEAMPTDRAGHPQCGLTILFASANTQDGITKGRITDPRDGKTYDAQIWIDGDGRLHLRGYIGIPLLGATQTWQPFQGHVGRDCHFN